MNADQIADAITQIKLSSEALSTKDREFALSLVHTAEKFKKQGKALSEKQIFWLVKMADAAHNAKYNIPASSLPEIKVGNMAGALALFDTAAKHLKFPSVVLHDATVGEVRLYRSGAKAKVPGSVAVVSPSVDARGRNTWYGRILVGGIFEHSEKCPDSLIALLVEFAKDPITVAAAHGKLTGKCCFCNKALSDEKSTAVGFGPICSKKWGLAWGTVAKQVAHSTFQTAYAAKVAEKNAFAALEAKQEAFAFASDPF